MSIQDSSINRFIKKFIEVNFLKLLRLYPDKNFTMASEWVGFNCNYSCVLMVNPLDSLFQTIGQAYVKEVNNY